MNLLWACRKYISLTIKVLKLLYSKETGIYFALCLAGALRCVLGQDTLLIKNEFVELIFHSDEGGLRPPKI